jgi:hypothetical protein
LINESGNSAELDAEMLNGMSAKARDLAKQTFGSQTVLGLYIIYCSTA